MSDISPKGAVAMTGTDADTEHVRTQTAAAGPPSGRDTKRTPDRRVPRRRMPPWLAGTIGFLVGLALAAGLVLGILSALRDDFRDAFWRVLVEALNPFTTSEVDRSKEPVLLSMKDLARFVAGEAQYEVLVDLERDVRYVPGWVAGERTVLVVNGSVEAYVDFAGLTEDAVVISDDGTTSTPAALCRRSAAWWTGWVTSSTPIPKRARRRSPRRRTRSPPRPRTPTWTNVLVRTR
jgi:hypothetical protein